MEAILPFKIKNEQKFYDSALKVGYNEMEIYKFIYVMQQSDVDIFTKMHDERINMLIYGWELCDDYKQTLSTDEWELPEEMEEILKHLVPWSMDIWFSKEWEKCKLHLKISLIHCLNRGRDLLMRMPDMMQINWDFLLLYNLKPWNVMYLRNLTVTKEKTLENGAQSIETEELPATEEDIAYLKLEQLPLIVLRLIKIFDQSSIDMVKTLCMRVIAAWNKIHQTELETSGSRRPYIPPEDKRCLLLICHIYLMAVYEADDVKGYVIDNMINNIRFYYQGFQNSTAHYVMDNLEYTPARFIALTTAHLRVQKRDFFDFFIWNKYDTSLVNLFGVVSQAYKSYLLGNLLMELNNMNEDDFASNIPLYKRLMNSYVNEREKSELFLLNELEKIENQRYAHNIIQTVKNITDFESKICKGNRMSNIGNYENSDDNVPPAEDGNSEEKVIIKKEIVKELVVVGEEDEDEQERVRIRESELRLDPIFQNLPNNQSILYYVYEVLAKKDYKGWYFAKVVLLAKIIDHELNMIETWRYHPGLTTDFMLNLEVKLSHHYVDLGKIFKYHPFLEQEFWLTAFYLNPTLELYETVKRLGMRNNRKRTEEHQKLVMSKDNIDAKYGLLSSTIDVKEISNLANTDDPDTDYNPLYAALHSLRLPDSLVKDMITAIFLPRNKSFAWVVDWPVLRGRCKMIMLSTKEKKRFVELNMAEANERLKYLIIDYEKYKNRPQLDYGTIEEGYENLMTSGDFDKDSDDEEEEEEEEEDFEDDEDVYESKRRARGSMSAADRKKEEEKVEDENSQEDDPFLKGKRRTRARTAATLASFLFQTLPRASRRKRKPKISDDEAKVDDDKTSNDNEDKSSDPKSPITPPKSPVPSPFTTSSELPDIKEEIINTRNIKECLQERPMFLNSTQGFQNLIDIWDVEKSDLQTIDENCVSLMESSAVLQKVVKWKLLNKEINPMGCDEDEFIDEIEMIIHNAEFAVKIENNLNVCKEEIEITDTIEEFISKELVTPMDVDEEVKENAELTETADVAADVAGENNEEVKSSAEIAKESSTEKTTEVKPLEIEEDQEMETSESINSDISTAANKDSEEVSETNTEMNSKRNSINIDTEVEAEKIINMEDLNESETTPQQKHITETEEENTVNEKQETKLDQEEETLTQETKSHQEEETLTQETKQNQEEETLTQETKPHQEEETLQLETKQNQEEETSTQETKQGQEEDALTQETKQNQEEETVMAEAKQNQEEETVMAEVKQNQEEQTLTKKTKQNHQEEETLTQENITLEKSLEDSQVNIIKENIEPILDPEKELTIEPGKDIVTEENKNLKTEETLEKDTKEQDVDKIHETKEMSDLSSKDSITEFKEIPEKSAENQEVAEEKSTINKEDDKINETTDLNEISLDKEGTSENKTISETNKSNSKSLENQQITQEENISDKSHTKLLQDIEMEGKENEINKAETKKIEEILDEKTEEKEIKVVASEENEKEIENKDEEANRNEKENEDEKVNNVEKENKDERENKDEKVNNDEKENKDEKVNNDEKENKDEKVNKDEKENNDEKENKDEKVNKDEKENKNAKENNNKEAKDEKDTENSQQSNVKFSETHIENKQDSFASNENNDNVSRPPSLESDSNLVLHYSSCDELENVKSAVKTEAEVCDDKKVSPTSIAIDDNTVDSIKSEESSDSETRNLKNLCLTKNLKVLVRKLQCSDLKNLRQPKVKVRRVHYEKYLQEFKSKRGRKMGKVYHDFDDSSNSNISFVTNSSSSDAYRPLNVKRKIPIRRQSVRNTRTPISDFDSNNSDDFKLSTLKTRKRRLSTPSTSQSSSCHATGPKSKRLKSGPKSSKQNLVVTPRSASGLKLRISNAEENTGGVKRKKLNPVVYDEIIQLSSGSSDGCALNELSFIEEVIEVEEHPLFEEEIII